MIRTSTFLLLGLLALTPSLEATDWYLGGSVFYWNGDDFDGGPGGSINLGAMFGPRGRHAIEGEVLYFNFENEFVIDPADPADDVGFVLVNSDSFPLLLNYRFSYFLGEESPYFVYAGAGFGLNLLSIDGNFEDADFGGDDTSFAYQFFVGAGYEFEGNIRAHAGVRYLDLDEDDTFATTSGGETITVIGAEPVYLFEVGIDFAF